MSYALESGWKGLLLEVGVEPVSVLRRANLPDDLLNQENVRLSADQFLRLGEAMDSIVPDGGFWVQIAEAISPEWFSPPVFAALTSPNLHVAARRLSRFKPLIAPIDLQVDLTDETLSLTYQWKPTSVPPPPSLHGLEALFITKLARLGTRAHIRPVHVRVPARPRNRAAFEDFLGIEMADGGSTIEVRFSSEDAERPFLTANEAMWRIFEPDLRRRLADLDGQASFETRTRAVLVEALPSGQVAMSSVARRLAVSTRTLQRRLAEEDTTFKEVVRATREKLARHYLGNTQLTATEIAYLLGFEEPTSFFRAFHRWTGSTPESERQNLHALS